MKYTLHQPLCLVHLDGITQLLQIYRLHMGNVDLLIPQVSKVLWIEMW